MTTDRKEPPISEALIEYLTALYPDRCPPLGTTEQGIWYAAGQASVAAKLRQLNQNQTNSLRT